VTTRPGIDIPGIGVNSSGPVAIASMYDGTGRVFWKTRVFQPSAPSAGVSFSSGVLVTTSWAAGASIVI
jgi:hypothetical protein